MIPSRPARAPRAPSPRLSWLGALLWGVLLLAGPAAAKAPAKKKPVASASKPLAPSSPASAQARKPYTDAMALLRAKRFDEASVQARRCIAAEPSFADCHMLLGSALASQSHWDDAAKEYRTFLQLAPDHRLAPKVRASLDSYDEASRRQ